MAVCRLSSVVWVCAVAAMLTWTGGCATTPSVSSRKLVESQAMIDFSGLKSPQVIPAVQTTISPPQKWEALPEKTTALYVHEQWRSPSGHTGVGILCAHLPFPLGVKAVLWLAKQQYARQAHDGRVLSEWTDEAGRSWFEGENGKYHVTGYAIVDGFTAWFVYFGYRTKYPPDVAEISLAGRSARTAVPMIDDAPTTQPSAQTAAAKVR